jgi:hypothetical protein
MHDPEQIELFAFARVVVPSRNNAELVWQAPTFCENSSGPGVVDAKLLGFEIEQIDTSVPRFPNDTLVLPRTGYQKSEPSYVVNDSRCGRDVGKLPARSRDPIGKHGRRHSVFPAAPQFGGAQGPFAYAPVASVTVTTVTADSDGFASDTQASVHLLAGMLKD